MKVKTCTCAYMEHASDWLKEICSESANSRGWNTLKYINSLTSRHPKPIDIWKLDLPEFGFQLIFTQPKPNKLIILIHQYSTIFVFLGWIILTYLFQYISFYDSNYIFLSHFNSLQEIENPPSIRPKMHAKMPNLSRLSKNGLKSVTFGPQLKPFQV